jgi:hypothetical protein
MRWLYSQKHDRGTIEKLAKIYLEELRLLSGN